jgi:hypothetical protein
MLFFLSFVSCRREDIHDVWPIENLNEFRQADDCVFDQYAQAFCLGSQYQSRSVTFNNIPGYPPECTFTVSYLYKWCTVGVPQLNEVHALIRDFFISSINCSKYNDDLDDLINNPCTPCGTPEEYLLNLENKLFELVTIELMHFIKSSNNFNFDCPAFTNFTPITMTFYQNFCHAYCLKLEPLNDRGGLWYKPGRIKCDGSVCCEVSYYMCIDPITGEVTSNKSTNVAYFPDSPQCNFPDPQLTDQISCNEITNCINACN